MPDLDGKTVLVTRPEHSADAVSELLKSHGARVLRLPTVEIADPESWVECDRAIINLKQYDGVVFTSRNAVDRLLNRIDAVNASARSLLLRRPLYAIGEKTQEALEGAGFTVAMTPEIASADGFAASFGNHDVAGKRFLFPKSDIARDILPNALRTLDAVVDEVVVYRTVPPRPADLEPIRSAFLDGAIDVVTFFSPSSVRNFLQMMGRQAMDRSPVAVIGPTTGDAVRQLGCRVDIVAPEATAESLVRAIVDFFCRQRETSQPL
ncbi:MAG: uroporphyrinogen-III synthase [Bacteroidota bacterium]